MEQLENRQGESCIDKSSSLSGSSHGRGPCGCPKRSVWEDDGRRGVGQASEAPQSRPRRTELEVRVLPDQSLDQREEEWAACKAYLLRAYDGDFYAVPNLKRAIRTDRDRFFEKLLSLPGSRKINFQEGILLKEAGALHCVSAKLVPAGALKVELPKRGVKPEVVEALTRDVSDPPRVSPLLAPCGGLGSGTLSACL